MSLDRTIPKPGEAVEIPADGGQPAIYVRREEGGSWRISAYRNTASGDLVVTRAQLFALRTIISQESWGA